MLTLALAATVVGFGLLVVALITGNFWLAVACIIVCVIGLAVLLVDTLRSGRGSGGGVDDEPLFTIRDREQRERSAPLLDETGQDDPSPTGPARTGSAPAGDTAAAGLGAERIAAAGDPERLDTSASGLGSLVDPEQTPPGSGEAAPVTGDANDYIKSVTGSFPAQAPSGHAPPSEPWPASAAPTPTADAGEPRRRDDGPDTGPIRAASPYVGRRRRGATPVPADQVPAEDALGAGGPVVEPVVEPAVDAGFGDADAEDAVVIEDAVVVEDPAVEDTAVEDTAVEDTAVEEAGSGQVAGNTFVVRDHTGPLPKITFSDGDR